MTLKVKFLLVYLVLLVSFPRESLGEQNPQEYYPFLGEITEDRVHVRAGQSANFESLFIHNKGDEAVVLDRKYSWYKVQLPKEANSFIHSKYIIPLGKVYGLVTSDRVNVRAGADINLTVLGQLKKGDKVRILEEQGDWLKINPIKGSYGWIHEDLIQFKAKSIPEYLKAEDIEYEEKPSNKKDEKTEIKQEIKKGIISEEKPASALTEPSVIEPASKNIVVKGRLEPVRKSGYKDIVYKLTIDGKPAYYLKANRNTLSKVDIFKVSIEGEIDENPEYSFPLPVLRVIKVQVIL